MNAACFLLVLISVIATGAESGPAGSPQAEYAWQGNDLGSTGEVPAPWTPLTADGERIQVWGRTVDFDRSLLPQRIVSQGVELLAGGASIAIVSDKQPLALDNPDVRFLERRPDRIVREATVQTASLTCQTETTVEFDGMVRIQLTLTPKTPTSVDRVSVTIPIAKDVARIYGRYLSYDFETLRTDKMSLATCTQRIEAPIHCKFNPEIWVGNRNVGLTWAAETNCQYDLLDAEKTLSVIPRADSVELVVNIVDHRIELRRPKTIDFALFPTPLKPVDPGMRQIRMAAFGRLQTAFRDGVSREHYDYYSICMCGDFEATHDSLPMSTHGERYRRLRKRLKEDNVKYIPYGCPSPASLRASIGW